MIITFKDYPENLPNSVYYLDILKEHNSILLTIRSTDLNNTELNIINYRFTKNQLKDFIGALLHIQSKLNTK